MITPTEKERKMNEKQARREMGKKQKTPKKTTTTHHQLLFYFSDFTNLP